MKTIESIYFGNLKSINEKYPLLSREDEIALCKKIQKGDKKAEETLILSNLNLVIKVVSKLHLNNVEKMDLIQDGNLALVEKAHCFDYTKGTRFCSYIWQWIWDSALHNNIRLSDRDNKLMRKIQNIQNLLKDEKGYDPSMQDIATYINMSEEELNHKLHQCEIVNAVSLDSPIKDDSGHNDFSLNMIELNNPYDNPEEKVLKEVEIKAIQSSIKRLPKKEQKIINKRYIETSDEDGKVNSLRKVAAEVNLTSEGVRMIEKRAIEQLKISLKREGLVA